MWLSKTADTLSLSDCKGIYFYECIFPKISLKLISMNIFFGEKKRLMHLIYRTFRERGGTFYKNLWNSTKWHIRSVVNMRIICQKDHERLIGNPTWRKQSIERSKSNLFVVSWSRGFVLHFINSSKSDW